MNLANIAQRVTVNFWSDEGRSLSLPVVSFGTASSIYFDLAANGLGVLETVGSVGGSSISGWATVTSTSTAAVSAVFRRRIGTQPDSEAASPMVVNPPQHFVLPFDHRDGFATGLALVNFGALSSKVFLTFRDSGGTIFFATTTPVGKGQHSAFSLLVQSPTLAGAVGTL